MIVEAFLASVMVATPPPDDDFWYGPRIPDSEVTVDSAMQVTAVLACVRVLAETMAQLPLHLKITDGRVRKNAVTYPLYEVLHDRPNSWQTSFEFREMMQGHVGLRGNAYAQIRPGPRGAVDQLIPLHPDRMQVFRLPWADDMPEAGRIGYLYQDRVGKQYRLTQDQIFHLRFMSLDDCVGMSIIAQGKYSVELAQKGEQHGIRFYRNAARPSGVVKMGENFKAKDQNHIRRLQTSWREAHSGDDLFSVAILEGGAEWQQLGLSNEDAQWLESRRFQKNDIASLFRVPPHMIGSAIEHGHTYANVEQSGLQFVTYTMLPWISRWEQAIVRDLIVQPEISMGQKLYPKFNLDSLLRADSLTRGKFYATMLDKRVYTRNEVRELEDMNPIDGGDAFDPVATAPIAPSQPTKDAEAVVQLAKWLGASIEKQAAVADSWATKMQIVADVRVQDARREALIEAQAAELVQREAKLRGDKQRHQEEAKRCDSELADRQTKLSERKEALAKLAEGHGEREADIRREETGIAKGKEILAIERQELTQRQSEIDALGQRIVRGWIADAAERIAALEIAALGNRAEKAAQDRSKFNTWAVRHWEGKVQEYIIRTLSPVLAAAQARIDTAALAADLCDSAIKILTTEDPLEVLECWKTDRAQQLGTQLTGDLCHAA